MPNVRSINGSASLKKTNPYVAVVGAFSLGLWHLWVGAFISSPSTTVVISVIPKLTGYL